MSVCYWTIWGIGLCAEDLCDSLSKEKVVAALRSKNDQEDDFDALLDSYLSWGGTLAEMFCDADETGWLIYADDGDGNSYLYYTPNYPWYEENPPKSRDEVEAAIVKAVQAFCNVDEAEIRKKIENLDVVGCG